MVGFGKTYVRLRPPPRALRRQRPKTHLPIRVPGIADESTETQCVRPNRPGRNTAMYSPPNTAWPTTHTDPHCLDPPSATTTDPRVTPITALLETRTTGMLDCNETRVLSTHTHRATHPTSRASQTRTGTRPFWELPAQSASMQNTDRSDANHRSTQSAILTRFDRPVARTGTTIAA